MTAIGPFADKQEIDFDRLGEGGLFLFEGPTGTGKSTVLDAITLALYGAVASESADIGRMHSHFAEPGTTPTVELEFSVNGVRYRILRTPPHWRPKKRGEGEVREKSSVHLSKLSSGNWESITTAQDEAGQIVTRELGLNRDQFTQVVLLPQGEFARFLKADDDARRGLLTKMFGADRYVRITKWLENQARAARQELDASKANIDTGLSALIEAGQADDETALRWEELVATWTPEVAARLESAVEEFADLLTDEQAVAGQDLGLAITATKAAAEKDQSLADQVDRLGRLAALQKRKRKQEENADEQKSRKERSEGARRAAPVRPLLENVTSRKRKNQAQIVAAADLVGGNDKLSAFGSDWSGLDKESRSLETKATSLKHLVEVEEALTKKTAEIGKSEERIAGISANVTSREEEQTQLPDRIETAANALTEAQQLANDEHALAADVARTRSELTAVEQVEALGPQVEAATGRKSAATDTHQAAVDEHQLLQDQRLEGMTGELAGRLVDGEPCSVCGSPDHPNPAGASAEAVSPEQVERAAEVRDKALASREAATTAHTELGGRLIAARTIAGETTVAQARAKLKNLNVAVKQAEQSASRVPGLKSKLDSLNLRREELVAELSELNVKLAAERTTRQKFVEAVESDQDRVQDELAGFPSISDRVANLIKQANRMAALSQAVRDVSDTASALVEAQQAVQAEADRQGFTDVEEADAALLEDQVKARMSREISDYEAESKAVDEQLAAQEFVGLDTDQAEAAVKAKAAAAQAAKTAVAAENAARTIADSLKSRYERFTSRRQELRSEVTERDSLGQQHAAVLDLDRLARGITGERRMTLTTFVLRYWFEQVVAAANLRLRKIAGGKYQLQRSEDAASRSDRVGLGLEVLDLYTGRTRSTGSLSGGETFYTSLALALGLADVVQAEAGGASLDTLFIDEGFGTLDEDTLQEVMTVIDGLRRNGRVVGIVSHVPDLKERISERLEVRRISDIGPSQVRVVA